MSWPSELQTEWRELALQQRDLGGEAQARTLEWCADQLEERTREWELEKLTLEEAAEESGYSRSSFERWISEGQIPNAGEEGAPRVRREDLPRKPPTSDSDTTTNSDLPDVEEILAGTTA